MSSCAIETTDAAKLSYLRTKVRLTKKEVLVLFIPYLTASTWYYLFSSQLADYALKSLGLASQTSWVNVYFILSIVFSIFIGNFFVDKFDKLHLIYTWATFMPITMTLLTVASDPAIILGLIFLLGALFGTGLLAYCDYFCDITYPEERGRISGIIIFASLLLYPIFLSLSLYFPNLLITYVILGVSTLTIPLLKSRTKQGLTTKDKPSRGYIDSRKTFLLYMIPQPAEIEFQSRVLSYFAGSFGALIGGVLADFVGRKATLLIGLASYGVSVAFSGFATTSIVFLTTAVVNGFSWGALLVIFSLIAWGDLSEGRNHAPFYAAGLIPFYLSNCLGYLALPQILYPFARYVPLISSFLICLSIILIFFAEELMPEYILEEINLTYYIQRLKEFTRSRKTSENTEKSNQKEKDR